jgi:hypothetical protein
MRRELLNVARPTIAHLLPDLQVSGKLLFAADVIRALPGYHHAILYEADPLKMPEEAVLMLQAAGTDVLHTPHTQPALQHHPYSAAILYDIVGCPGLGRTVPSIYYSYGEYDPEVGADLVVCSSEYARTHARNGAERCIPSDMIIPPAMNTRAVRGWAAWHEPLTIGIISSGNHDKFPYALTKYLVEHAESKNYKVLVSLLDRYSDPTFKEWLDEQATRSPRLLYGPVRPTAGTHYLRYCNVLVYGTATGYYEPFGRVVAEALAMGMPVVCERKGAFQELLQDRTNVLFYDTPEEALEQALYLYTHRDAAEKLAANGVLWASWQDITVHTGRIKGLLRMLGA